MAGGFCEGVEQAARFLRIKGRVYPAATESLTLVVRHADGSVTRGESVVRQVGKAVSRVEVEPEGAQTLANCPERSRHSGPRRHKRIGPDTASCSADEPSKSLTHGVPKMTEAPLSPFGTPSVSVFGEIRHPRSYTPRQGHLLHSSLVFAKIFRVSIIY
jgi:hypothetical protein